LGFSKKRSSGYLFKKRKRGTFGGRGGKAELSDAIRKSLTGMFARKKGKGFGTRFWSGIIIVGNSKYSEV